MLLHVTSVNLQPEKVLVPIAVSLDVIFKVPAILMQLPKAESPIVDKEHCELIFKPVKPVQL
jgi:hypothetical protein